MISPMKYTPLFKTDCCEAQMFGHQFHTISCDKGLTDDDFCLCATPSPEDITCHTQEGGEIVERVLGQYCTKCGKDLI